MGRSQAHEAMTLGAVLCVDVGSTFTKAVLVDLAQARIVATTSHRTTIDTDVLDGLDACRDQLVAHDPRAVDAAALVCSSAGGGLRIAVVGNEALVTAEAGRRVALNSGGAVVAVLAAAETTDLAAALVEADPDVVLLTGGTDGGNREVLLDAAGQLADGPWAGPVVVAGNVEARDEAARLLADRPHVLADNVVPRIGVLAPESARRAVREIFLSHVIGGKHLSSRPDRVSGRPFTALVRGATPDVVLAGVELLASEAGDVVVVDVGGATTDVHSVVEVDPETSVGADGLSREVVAPTPVTRTVEGDLGMRWSAPGTLAAGREAGLLDDDAGLDDAAARRRSDPDLLPDGPAEAAYDVRLAAAAVGVAMRRHAGRARVVLGEDGRVVERTGTDLREVDLLVGSGGVLRHREAEEVADVLAAATGPVGDGWQLPEHAEVTLDGEHVLAVAGLLRDEHPEVARRLVTRLTPGGIACRP